MAKPPAAESNAVAVRPQRVMVAADIPIYDTAKFEHQGRIATVLARSFLMPETLRGETFEETQANAFLVVSMAERWGLEPTQVAQGCSVVYGKLMLEGKLVAAILDSKLGIELLHYYKGERGKDSRRVYVTDVEITEEEFAALEPGNYPFRLMQRMIDGSIAEWKTKKKSGGTNDAWVDPQQADMQLRYRGDRVWTRAYRSALLLGVYTPEELTYLREDREDRVEREGRQPPRLTSGFGDEPPGASLTGSGASGSKEAEPREEAASASAGAAESHDPETGEVISGEPAGEPTTTASAPAAEGDPASSASATNASGNSAAETSSQVDTSQASSAGEKATAEATAGEPDAGDQASGGQEAERTAHPAEEALSDQGQAAAEQEKSALDTPEFKECIEKINGADHWLAIKQAVRTCNATQAWKDASNADASKIRGMAFARFKRLTDMGKEKTAISSDPYLFRLWMNHGATSRKEIVGLFPSLMRSPDYSKMTDGQKNDFGLEMERVCSALDEG